MRRHSPAPHGTRMARGHLRFNRRFQKMLDALKDLEELGVLDLHRLRRTRLVLEHSRARLSLDIAEWAQEFELNNCNESDRRLRRFKSILDSGKE